MEPQGVERRLAAILCADVVGYSRLMGADEEATLLTLNLYRQVIDRQVASHRGRVFGTAGDSVIAEFASPVEAVRCAVAIQQQLEKRNAELPEDRKMQFRIGINLGDVMVEGDNLLGDGVNVAARLEGLAEPGGICISGDVYNQVKHKLSVGFEDLGPQEVKNIAEPVHVYRIEMVPDKTGTAPAAPVDAVLNRPALAVLPFINMSGESEQEYFTDGLTEDIITALAAWRSFPVIARTSSFIYKGKAVAVKQVAQELGARYVLEGSVRKGGNRLRISAQLIDATTGHHVWAERFDRDLEDIFALQDEITQRIVATVEPELGRAEQQRSAVKKPTNLDAWDCFQRGMWLLYKFTKEGNAQAREVFERALELDATYCQALTGLAYSHQLDILFEYTDSRAESIAQLLEAARRAVALDDTDSFAHVLLAFAFRWSGQHDLAVAEAERAVELNPSNAMAQGTLGNVLDLAGRPEEGIPKIEQALQLNPRDIHNHFFMTILARAHLNARHYETAVEWARKAIQRRSDHARAHLVLAISLGHLGRQAEARAALDECKRLQPGYAEKWIHWQEYRNPADNEHLLDGLRKAGLLEKSSSTAP